MTNSNGSSTKEKVLVTGAGGFIGSHLVESLLEKGYSVVCFLKNGENNRWIKNLDVSIVHGDLTEKNSMYNPIQGVTYVYHLAANMGGKDNPDYIYKVNYEGTKNLIEVCIESNVKLKRFLYASTVATMGATGKTGIFDEKKKPNPSSYYGKMKLKAENYLEEMKKSIPYTIVRFPLVYGPRNFDGMYPVFKLANVGFQLVIGKSDTNVGYVKDIVKGMIHAAENPAATDQMFLLGEDKIYSTHEIINHIAEAVGKKTIKIPIPYFLLYFLVFVVEIFYDITGNYPLMARKSLSAYLNSNWRFSMKKAREKLGFKIEYPLPKGLKETAKWYRDNGFF